jgi:hypothetical protein
MSHALVTINGVLDWMIGFITGNYSAIADLYTLQFTAAHTLEFSAFISRILATDLSQSHCNFKAHMEYSYHSLIPFLPFLLKSLCQLPAPETRLIS